MGFWGFRVLPTTLWAHTRTQTRAALRCGAGVSRTGRGASAWAVPTATGEGAATRRRHPCDWGRAGRRTDRERESQLSPTHRGKAATALAHKNEQYDTFEAHPAYTYYVTLPLFPVH